MSKKRKFTVIALFITTLLIGGVAIFVGYRLSQQGLAPDDAAAYEQIGGGVWKCTSGGDCCVGSDSGPATAFTWGGVPGGSQCFGAGQCRIGAGGASDCVADPNACSWGFTHYRCDRATYLPNGCQENGENYQVGAPDPWVEPHCGIQQIDRCNGTFESRRYTDNCTPTATPTPTAPVGQCYCGYCDDLGARQCKLYNIGSCPSGTTCQTGCLNCDGGGNATPTPSITSTPTPTPIPFDIQILATCQDGNGPSYSVGGAQLIIGSGNNTILNVTTNDNGAYTSTRFSQPFVGHVRIGGSGTVTIKERANYPNGNVVRTVDISQLTKITPVTGNSTGLAPQCTTSGGTNTAGQCDCGGQYETCNLNQTGANSSNRFFFEFKFSNCLGTTTTTPTSTPTPTPTGTLTPTVTPTGTITPSVTPSVTPPVPQCGDSCTAGSSNCAAGTTCYNTGANGYRCVLNQCAANPAQCNPDLCSFANAVTVNKTATLTCINGGDTAQVDYSVVISNTMANTRTINVSDDLDSKVQSSYVQNASITLGGIHSNGVINWSNLSLPGSSTGTTLTLNYRLLVPQSAYGNYTNTVTVNEGGTIRGTDTVAINVNCLPGTALISDKADRIILAVIMITSGIAIFRMGWHRDIGNWAWFKFGEGALVALSPKYRKQKFEKNLVRSVKRKTSSHKKRT